ncbi:YidC/Oxa1 family membrane protein insertase [Homoserinibacter sp. GY 40078]|uniref:YidC/Oxa1 family membrane protein insertase n=1 Tax=Homoserinibacter sp. GY 40078 TaxID=2603275 RepID=UPI0011CB603F|nr:YidC/Oxa1 family membrane protein insertase [Homoserinibacter sp. GY 40078]TXK19628.1 YidC/Oxa1 family membrane protein insertase [Homoserinibacter sp. GY 40078]
MNPFDLPPLAALLEAAASALTALSAVVTPAGAIVVVTILVRAVLIPVGVSVAKAARGRRRLAPKLAELQRRYRRDPQRLQKATLELYAAEKASPFAGCLPMLAQAPVLALVYALFASATIGGAPNHLLEATFLGVGLGRHLGDLAGGVLPGDIAFLVILVVLGVAAWLGRRLTLRDAVAPPTGGPSAGALLDPRGALSWTPFLVLIGAAVVPLAAGIYLAVSGVWTCVERHVLRAVYA